MKSMLQKAKRWLGAALAFAVTASFAATPDALIHRWSFNNSLEDTGSIGGMTANLCGSNVAVLYNQTSVRVNAGEENNNSYVELGANPIPSSLGDTPFTIEVWATPTAITTWASVFALGERSNASAKGFIGTFQSGTRQIREDGDELGGPAWQAIAGKINGNVEQNVAMTRGLISTGTAYYFAYVVMPKGDGTSATVIGYVYNASTGAQVGKSVMYTVENWTTALLNQSTFNLGTTPWDNGSPGADYDEVRVWKKALTPGQIAANVAHGPNAIPGDGNVSDGRLRTETATLAHRWSFNGSLKDSVTGDTSATSKGAFFAANGAVRFPGGTQDGNYVALGANKMPSDSVTLEFFSTVYKDETWAKMFCLGKDATHGISFSYKRGNNDANSGKPGLEIYPPDPSAVDCIPNALEVNKPYHFTFTFSCNGTDTIVKGYCIDLTNPGTIWGSFERTLSNWKMSEKITLEKFNLGWSFWGTGDVDPNADFDEVRVWNGVLSEAEVLKSAAAGADATINPAFPEAPEDLIHRWSFNGNLEDSGSIGLNTATIKGNAGLLNGNSVRVNRGDNGTSWVELGGNPIPTSLGDTPFTIEVWATPNDIPTYASIFSLGQHRPTEINNPNSGPATKGLMGVFYGYRNINYEGGQGGYGPVWQALCGKVQNSTGINVAMTQNELPTGKAYYFAYVVTPTGDGTSAKVIGYVYNAYTGELVGKSTMYTATEWTTALLNQSSFNLGTTPWDNANPGADYDEVRVWKKAFTAADVASSVRCGPDVVPATRFVTETATLAHRWSFNGSLEDSVTGDEATMAGAALAADGTVRFKGGSRDSNYVSLGSNKMPSDSVTLEFFSTMYDTQQVWAKMFCLGQGEKNGISFSYIRGGYDANKGKPGLEIITRGNDGLVDAISDALEANKPYLFTLTFSCDGTDTTVKGYCIDLTNPGTIRGQFSRTISGWKLRSSISQDTFNLGWSFWGGDGAPNADFDEVRVWDGVLSEAEVLASAAAGADAAINPEAGATNPETLLHRWSFNGSLTDTGIYGGSDAVTFGTAKLVDGTSVRTYYGGEKKANSSYVSLGANMIPASLGNTPFTIEMWATPRELLRSYYPAFTFGKPDDSGSSNKALMFVFHGVGQIRPGSNTSPAPVFQALGSNQHEKNVSMSTAALTVDTRYHVSLVVEPQADDTVTITGYVHDDAGNLVGSGAQSGITGWNATTLTQYAFLLGRNPWHDGNPSAEYDEVRIWSRAFTAGELSVNAKNGPDTIIDFDAPAEPDSYLHWVQSTGSQFIELPGVTGRTGTKIQAVISGFGGDGQVLVGSHSSAGHISWKDDGGGWVGMGYKDKTDWGLNGYWNSFYDAAGKGTLTSQISPLEFTLDLNGNSTWYSDGFNPNKKLSEGDKTAYDTGLDMYVFALNDNGTAANRAFCKLYSLKIWQTATTDGTGDYTLVADLKPCVKNGLAALYDAVSGKVLFSDGAAPLTAGPVLTPHPSGCLMDYTFTTGEKVYSGTLEEPVTTAPGYTAVHGTNGYGTAVHACGYGAIPDGENILNNGDWTLAMSVKSCDIDNGILLALGGNGRTTIGRELRIVSSSTPGKLSAVIVQTWSTSDNDKQNTPAGSNIELTDLGDTTGSFHSLVAVYTKEGTKIKLYWDGVFKGEFNSLSNIGDTKLFRPNFQFGDSVNNNVTDDAKKSHVTTAYNPDVAFQNVRLYGKALSADEIAAYAAEFPAAAATKGSIGDYGFRHSFSTGKLVSDNGTFASTGGFNDNGLAGTGTAVDAPAYAAEGVKACFPDKTGYGTVTGGLNRDWTIAMSVKGPTVSSGKAVMFSFGGVEEYTSDPTKKAVAICTDANGGLVAQIVQRHGSGNDNVNAVGSVTLSSEDLGGSAAAMFHTLVIVNERNIKTDVEWSSSWNSGMLSFYWDGVYKGSLTDGNGQYPDFTDKIRYGAIYNRTIDGFGEPDAASGLSFQDLRFIPQVWTSAEAKDYAAAFPVAPTANVTLTVGGADDFAGSQQITITGGGQIYYTLDGLEPTPENGILYTGAFTLAGSAQFRARAFSDGTPVSQTVSRTFTEATDTAAYDYVFRYNFVDGVKNYNHHGCATEPAGTAAGYAAVHGTNGYAKAIHPTGYGTIVDGMARLNNDWTLAMCVKPGDLEKGILLSLGDNNAIETKEFAICSSSKAGRIHAAVVQKWNSGTDPAYKNLPFAFDINVGGDTTGSFHSLVVTHVAKEAYDAGTGQAWSGVITFYWDGVEVQSFDSSSNGGEREFGNGFKFGGLHDGMTPWLAQQGYVETAYDVESAFRDVRFYARTLTADEIADYAAAFPAENSTSGDIGTFDFRHDFTGGSLAVTGSAFTDGGIAAATIEALGPAGDDAAKAAWPGRTGYGTIGGVNMNGDWTLAMSVKAQKVSDDEKGIMVSLGGVNAKGVKALTIGSTADSTGGLFFGLTQRWGSGEAELNTCNGQVTLTGLGDTTKEFHSLVIVHASGLRTNNADYWKTGTYAIYWDGVYKGAVATDDGAGQNIGNFIKYGSLHDRMPATPATWGGNYPHYTETASAESGLAFRDLRFAGRMWTGTEVKAYSEAFPAVKQKSRGITVLVY